FDHLTPSLCRFGLQEVDEETPACIIDALGKAAVLEQSFYIKGFDGNESVTIDQGTRYFVSHIPTLIGNMRMCLRKLAHSFLTAMASLLASGDHSLQLFQFAFGFAKILSRGKELTIRGNRK